MRVLHRKTLSILWSVMILVFASGMAGGHPTTSAASPTLPVFPGAEGFGTTTPAGSGRHLSPVRTTVYKVTNLNPTGAGSLRACVEASGPRVCVFEVSGYISIDGILTIENPYITIAGQTAPSPGITLKGTTLRIRTHDVLVQHLRIRVGDKGGHTPENRDGIDIVSSYGKYDVYNIVIDHCSISWAIDGNVDMLQTGVRDITLSNCFITEALHHSLHPQGAHSTGFLIGDYVKRVSVHHTLLAHNWSRNPRAYPDTETELVNNVVYNWGKLATCYGPGDGGPPMFANVIGNYYREGPDIQLHGPILIQDSIDRQSKFYAQGNIGPGRPSDDRDEWDIVDGDETIYRSNTPVVTRSVATVQPATEALGHVLKYAGARPTDRDAVDTRIVTEVQNGTGRIIDSQDEVGGWPNLAQNRRPLTLPSNPNGDNDDDGYTNLEEWLNNFALELEGLEGNFGINTEPYTHVTDPGSVVDYTISVQPFGALSEDVTLTFSDPSMYLYGSLDRTSLGPSDRAILTVTDTHSGPTLMPGRWYGVFITGTTSSLVRPTKVRILVGGAHAYLPIIRIK